MTNALIVDTATGFLQNNFTSNYGFTAEKKVQFLELATAYRKDGKFPKVSAICDLIGINIRSFERHLEVDEPFKIAWEEISTHVEYDCISDMSELRRKNPMYMFGLLRYLNPKRWNPNDKSSATVNINMFADTVKKIAEYQDASVVPTDHAGSTVVSSASPSMLSDVKAVAPVLPVVNGTAPITDDVNKCYTHIHKQVSDGETEKHRD